MVYILIVNYSNWPDTGSCVHHLLKLSDTQFKIIIISNGTETFADEALPEIAFYDVAKFQKTLPQQWNKLNVVRTQNRGYGAAVNVVLREIRNENVFAWLLNPDVLVAPNALAELKKCAETGEGKTIYGCKMYSATQPEKVVYLGGYRVNRWSGTISFITRPGQVAQLQAISGGCLFAPAKAFAEVGLFPEDYFVYWEDTEWSYRARQQQYRLRVCEDAICYDRGSTTIGKGFLADYYYAYNGLRFLRKFHPVAVPVAVAANFLRMGKRLVQGQRKNAQAILFSTLHFVTGRKPDANRILRKHK